MDKMSKENTPQRVRFTSDDDLALLREVVNINPLKDVEKWKEVKDAVQALTGNCFSLRSLKDHLHLLLEIWRKKDATNLGKSGIEEVYSEKDTLLQEISDICRELHTEVKRKRTKVVSRNEKIILLGKEHRASTTAAFYNEKVHDMGLIGEDDGSDIQNVNMHDYCIEQNPGNHDISIELRDDPIQSETIEVPAAPTKESSRPTCDVTRPNKQKRPKVRALRNDALKFIEERSTRDYSLKKRELELEEKKVNLEERRIQLAEEKFKLEKEERIFKMNLEKEKFLVEKSNNEKQQSLIEQQQKFIDVLTNKLNHK